ncbi:hypothetical protein D3C86_1492030 [compost metagenome]
MSRGTQFFTVACGRPFFWVLHGVGVRGLGKLWFRAFPGGRIRVYCCSATLSIALQWGMLVWLGGGVILAYLPREADSAAYPVGGEALRRPAGKTTFDR